MTEIEIRNEQAVELAPVDTMGRLARWVEQAQAVSAIAADICATSFAPAAYRGKPAEATAAILAGAELGFDPMASLRAFDNIQGVPAPKAITLRAVVQGAGHQVVIVESTHERAEVHGRRRGEDEWQVSVWNLDRARKMDLLKKDQWQKQPAAMLVARATAEVCRWIASDAIMGMPYASEEIGDQPALSPSPLARKVTLADLEPALTKEQIVAAAATLEDREYAERYAETGKEPLTDYQRKTMFALWRDLGFDGDVNRPQRLKITRKIVGDPGLETSSHLTREQADTVIAALRERLTHQVAPAEDAGGSE